MQLSHSWSQCKGNVPVYFHELHSCDKVMAEKKLSTSISSKLIFFSSLKFFVTFFLNTFVFVTCTLLETLKCNVRMSASYNLNCKSSNVLFSLWDPLDTWTSTFQAVQVLLTYIPSSIAVTPDLMATISHLNTMFYALRSLFCWANSVNYLCNHSSDGHFC